MARAKASASDAATWTYTAVIQPGEEEGGYIVTFPARPDLATQGETLAEARVMAEECLRGYLEVLRETAGLCRRQAQRRQAPEPRSSSSRSLWHEPSAPDAQAPGGHPGAGAGGLPAASRKGQSPLFRPPAPPGASRLRPGASGRSQTPGPARGTSLGRPLRRRIPRSALIVANGGQIATAGQLAPPSPGSKAGYPRTPSCSIWSATREPPCASTQRPPGRQGQVQAVAIRRQRSTPRRRRLPIASPTCRRPRLGRSVRATPVVLGLIQGPAFAPT
jgi:predicted RNase H-like HicB family nuclease